MGEEGNGMGVVEEIRRVGSGMGVVDEIRGGWATFVYSNHWEGRLVGWFEEYRTLVMYCGWGWLAVRLWWL